MDFDYDDAQNFMFRVVAAGNISTGIKKLLEYCRKSDPPNSQWLKLRKINFEADARRVVNHIKTILPKLESHIRMSDSILVLMD